MIRERLPFFSDCVGWPKDKLPALMHIVGNRVDISRQTYVARVDPEARREIERNLGYGPDFPISKDYHVRFCTVPGSGVYFMVHSAIEHVFATEKQIDALMEVELAEEMASDGPPKP